MGMDNPFFSRRLLLKATGLAATGAVFGPNKEDPTKPAEEQMAKVEIEGHTELIEVEVNGEKIKIAVIKFSLSELYIYDGNSPVITLSLDDENKGGLLFSRTFTIEEIVDLQNEHADEQGQIAIVVTQNNVLAEELKKQGMFVVTANSSNSLLPRFQLSHQASLTVTASTAVARRIMPQGNQAVLFYNDEKEVKKTFRDLGKIIQGESSNFVSPEENHNNPYAQLA